MADRSLDDELDRLYGEPPDGFVAGRDKLARALKDEGSKEQAAAVKKLRRPSQAAALVNWLSHERATEMERFVKSVASMRDPAATADGTKLRAAVKAERESIQALLEEAEEELERRGGGGSSQTLDRAGETLRAMATDPDLERSVLSGRLEREREASTIGFELSVKATSAGPKKEQEDAGPDLDAERTTLDGLRRRLEAAEEREQDVADRLERAEQKLAAAREALKGAKADAKGARADVRKQERRIAKLADG